MRKIRFNPQVNEKNFIYMFFFQQNRCILCQIMTANNHESLTGIISWKVTKEHLHSFII